MATILVVDDELGIRALLSEILTDEGHTVELAENAAQARQVRESLRPDLVLLDIWMPDVDGVTLLKEWSAGGQLSMPVIMMSGHGTIDTAVEAIRSAPAPFLKNRSRCRSCCARWNKRWCGRRRAYWPWPPCCRPTVHRGLNPRRWATMASQAPCWPARAASQRQVRRPSKASISIGRCAKRATLSRRAISSFT